MVISGKLFGKVPMGARRCQIQRIVYDWHFTGRNRFKASQCSADMRCPLCLHPQEDQTHIVWHCSHPDMAQLRAEHCALLSSTMLNSIGKSDDTAFQNALASLHTSLMHPPHVSLLLGRVHAHQRSLLNFPSLKVIHLPMLVDTWKNYAAFAVDMYSMRQQLIAHTTGLMPKVFKSVVGSRVLAAREALIGIEATTLLHSDGTRVVSSGYDKDTVIIAHKRGKLDVLNCQVARSLQRPKRMQDPTRGPPLPPPKHRTEAPTEE